MKEGFISDRATGKILDGRKPEEAVRQNYEKELCEDYGYSYQQMDIEVSIQRGERNSAKSIEKYIITSKKSPIKASLCLKNFLRIFCLVETIGGKLEVPPLRGPVTSATSEFNDLVVIILRLQFYSWIY